MTQSKDNAERAERARIAVIAYLTHRGDLNPSHALEHDWTYLADLLCDLRHLADEKGLDFEELNARAHENHADEVERGKDE